MAKTKVYFGPFKHSPAPELQHDERRLWFTDYGLLKGVDADFWTSNPLMLDVFDRDQVFVWLGEAIGWADLNVAAMLLMPEKAGDPMVQALPSGKLALALELMRHLEAASANREKPEAPGA